MTLRVVPLATYAANGGAVCAATPLHRAMQRRGVDSRLVTAQGTRFTLARSADRQLRRLQRSPVVIWRSPARFGSINASSIDALGADIINLHWVTDGFLTVEAIGAITTPYVWSMYDMWPFTARALWRRRRECALATGLHGRQSPGRRVRVRHRRFGGLGLWAGRGAHLAEAG